MAIPITDCNDINAIKESVCKQTNDLQEFLENETIPTTNYNLTPLKKIVSDKLDDVNDHLAQYVIPTEATYSKETIDNKMNATLPYSGYTKVSKKLDNFVFQESSSFLNKVADKTRYVKFGDKVVDAYGDDLVTNGDFSDGLTGWNYLVGTTPTITNNIMTLSSNLGDKIGQYLSFINGKTYAINFYAHITSGNAQIQANAGSNTQSINEGLNTFIFTYNSTYNWFMFRTATNGSVITIDNISVREIQTAQFQVPEVTEIITEASGVTTVLVSKGNYVIQSRTDDTDHTQTTFRAKQDAPIGTALTNTTYFEDRSDLGVTNQQLDLLTYNTSTNSFEGKTVDTVFNDISKTDLLDNPTFMSANGYSKVSDFLYSKDDKLYLLSGFYQHLNKGLYHLVLNPFGTKKASDNKFWYDTTVSFTSVADCFDPAKLLTASGYISSGVSGRPDGKYYDICYSDLYQECREYAKVLTPYEVDLIRDDKIENGVEGMVQLYAPYYFTSNVSVTATYNSVSGYFTTDFSGNDSTYGDIGDIITITGNNGKKLVIEVLTDGVQILSNNRLVIWVYSTNYSTRAKVRKELCIGNFESASDLVTNFPIGTKLYVYKTKTKPILSSSTKLSIDLIGSPTSYPQIMLDRLASGVGIVGVNPLLISDTGDTYIPNGALTNYKVSRKALGGDLVDLYSTDGVSYTTVSRRINSISNLWGEGSFASASNSLVLINYTSKNNPLIQSNPYPVIEVEPKVIATNSHSLFKGALIGNQVSGKIQVGNGANGYESRMLEGTNEYIGQGEIIEPGLVELFTGELYYMRGFASPEGVFKRLGSYYNANLVDTAVLDGSSNWERITYGGFYTPIQHNAITLDNSTSSASKYFNTLEEGDNGVLAGVYGEEITYDGISEWGDTDFSQLTNGTLPDVNGGSDVKTFHGVVAINGRIK